MLPRLVSTTNATVRCFRRSLLSSLSLSLSVGRKTASVVMSQAFGMDTFPVDTHIHRLALRWGLTKNEKNANK